MPDYKNNPPSWQPNSKKSAQGWRHPETGELLVAVRMNGFEEVLVDVFAPKEEPKTQEPVLNAVVDFKVGAEEANKEISYDEVIKEPIVEEKVQQKSKQVRKGK